jgi:hypothetical protein
MTAIRKALSLPLILLGAVLLACTTLAPTARDIPTTREPAAIANCKAVGNVASIPPYILPGDDLRQLKNQAAGLGGDMVLITGPRLVSTQGIAYRCQSSQT